jgi:two-component system osmolarity sensor histidine kinase EnvZ
MGIAAKTNHSFNQMVKALAQLEADRALMLAGISHDLRTPLARLRLETEMIQTDAASKKAMIADIEQMDTIISRFLDYARPSQRSSEVVDLSALAQDAVTRLIHEEHMRITLDLAESALIAADPADVHRILDNLLENARKYGYSRVDNSVDITLRTTVSPQTVELRVLDGGPGVPPNQLDLITHPFYRGEAARTQANGTGLGMAIVQRLVRRHHGTLQIANRTPDPGLAVTLTFPRV